MGPDQRAGEPVMMISSSVREQRSTSDVDSMLDRNVVGDATEKARGDLKRVLGAGYILVMALCGMVAVALGSTLEDLAANCNRESTEVCTSTGYDLPACSICLMAIHCKSIGVLRWWRHNVAVARAVMGSLAASHASLTFSRGDLNRDSYQLL